MILDVRSRQRLAGVHPDLVEVVHKCAEITDITFCITEGVRTIDRQKKLIAAGASQTMRSRHLTGHAIDFAAMVDFDGDGDLEIRWDWPLYKRIADKMKEAAKSLDITIEWGGDWKNFKDGPHIQLPWKKYPEDSSGGSTKKENS